MASKSEMFSATEMFYSIRAIASEYAMFCSILVFAFAFVNLLAKFSKVVRNYY